MPRINVQTPRLKDLREKAAAEAGSDDVSDSSATSKGQRSPERRMPKRRRMLLSRALIPTPTVREIVDSPLEPTPTDIALEFRHQGVAARAASGARPGAKATPAGSSLSGVSLGMWDSLKSEMMSVDIGASAFLDLDAQIHHAFKHSIQSMMALACARASLGSRSLEISELEEEVKKLKIEVEAALRGKSLADEKLRCIEVENAKLKEKLIAVELEKSSLEDEMVVLKMKHAAEIEDIRQELEAVRRGEGMDLEALADSYIFKPTRDAIEGMLGEAIVKMIQGRYPDLDLSFVFSEDDDASSSASDGASGIL